MYSLDQIFPLLLHYKYLALFFLAIVEGPIVTVIAGFLSSTHVLNFLLVYIVIIFGDLAGDAIYYLIGYKGRSGLLSRWGKYLGVDIKSVESLEEKFQSHSGKILILGKLSHGIGGAVLLAAGLARYSFWRFIFYNGVATLIKSLGLLFIGFYFGKSLTVINSYLGKVAVFSIGLGVIVSIIYVLYRRTKNGNLEKSKINNHLADLDYLHQRWLETNNGKLCYYVNQDFPGRPTVVFLHGLSAHYATWQYAMDEAWAMKFNIVAPDLRGHGLSDKTKKSSLYKLPVFTDDLKKILDQENIQSAILVGYSFGGHVALDFASHYPQKAQGAVLISTNHVNPLKYWHIGFLSFIIYYFLWGLSIILLWQGKNEYKYNYDRAKGYWRSVINGLKTMPLSVNFWMLSEIYNLDLRKEINKIECSVLIVRGAGDPYLTKREARDMANKIKNSEIITLEHSNHYLASAFQNQTLETITIFLKKYL